MKVLHISESDLGGGAAKAAFRLHAGMLKCGQSSQMLVRRKLSQDTHVFGPKNTLEKITYLAGSHYSNLEGKLRRIPSQEEFHSSGRSCNKLVRRINQSECDVVHLHWINSGLLSIEQIAKIKKPLVWTLHDMWPFCGAEHYSDDANDAPWVVGYNGSSVADKYRASVFNRKLRAWKDLTIHVVATTSWMAHCAIRSKLMGRWPIESIPYTLDIDVFKPLDQKWCRIFLNLPTDRPLILLGAAGGGRRKGYDLLRDSIWSQKDQFLRLGAELVVFGSMVPVDLPPEMRVHTLGHISDEYTMAAIYNACEMMVVPSRQEAFGQTASEPQACGVPVVAFDATGLSSVVENGKSGRLVQAFDPERLGHTILELLNNPEMRTKIGHYARERAEKVWNHQSVVNAHYSVYNRALQVT